LETPGICNNAGHECQGQYCANSGCDVTSGLCTTCSQGRYHGKHRACENKFCPKVAVTRSSDPIILANSTDEQVCSCNPAEGTCVCPENTWGPTCSYQMCPFVNDPNDDPEFVRSTSRRSCHGQGRCDNSNGKCFCDEGFSGISCERDEQKGAPEAPKYYPCPGMAEDGKWCDRNSGLWTCESGTGPQCDRSGRNNVVVADWTLSMDKRGWSLCPEGTLLFGLNRGPAAAGEDTAGDALYSIETAKCAAPSAGEVVNCYHQSWWQALDSPGGAFCRHNYFVAGLFRSSCNSLYCVDMAKCCQVRHATWSNCKWQSMDSWNRAHVYAEATGTGSFITGFFRDGLHTLNGLTKIRQCQPEVWGHFDERVPDY